MTSPSASRRVVVLRGHPDAAARPHRPPPPFRQRLGDRAALCLFAAADAGVGDDRLGLGAALVTSGASVLAGVVIVPDDCDRRQARRWATRLPHLDTPSGERAWEVVSVSEFCDPFATVENSPCAFYPRCYAGGGWCIGVDLGRTLGLLAEHVVERTGVNAGSWELWFPGVGRRREDGGIKRASPHRPALRLTARRVGWHVSFGPCPREMGKYVDGRQWRGAFVDALSLAYALDADRGASYAEHRANFGLSPDALPLRVPVDRRGMRAVTAAVLGIHELAVVLDERASLWFTTPTDRAEARGRVDLATITSPGRLAADALGRFGLRPPAQKFTLSDDLRVAWAEAFHGGWCDVHQELRGVVVPVVPVDVSSAFPVVAHHLGWWSLLCAHHVRTDDVTDQVVDLSRRVVDDPAAALEPRWWRRLGCTLVEVAPDGEPWPVEVEDPTRPDGRFEVIPVRSPDRPMFFTWPDVVAAAARAGRVPTIVSARRITPVGRQDGIRKELPLLPGLVLHAEGDPAVDLVVHRRSLRQAGDAIAGAELRVVVNALVYGNPARFDEVRQGREGRRSERPGPWTFLPLAASVSAGSRLLLAVLDRLVTDRGGVVAYRDTDSSAIVATGSGGPVNLPGGRQVHALAEREVDEVLAAFDGLAPEPTWPVWKREVPRRLVAFGPKRYAEVAVDGDEVLDSTESALGGFYVDPPSMPGRIGTDVKRRWARKAAAWQVSDGGAGAAAPWDVEGQAAFPAVRRLRVPSPEVLHTLPPALGARVGTPFLELSGSGMATGRSFVALDPGGDLTGWSDLVWLDRSTGDRTRVATLPERPVDESVMTLAMKARDWREPPKSAPLDGVVVDPHLIAKKGRVSGMIDADEDGEVDDLAAFRPVYQRVDGAGFVAAEVDRLGPVGFAGRYGVAVSTAKHLSAARPPGAATVKAVLDRLDGPLARVCALEECEELLDRSNRRYCCRAHRDRAYRRRRGGTPLPAAASGIDDPVCPDCGVVLLGAAVQSHPCQGGA